MTSTTTAAPTSRPPVTESNFRSAVARRWPTGIAIAAAAASLSLLVLPAQLQVFISAWWLLLAAVIYLTWGTVRGDLADRRLLTAQTVAVLGFGFVAIATMALDPDVARYVLAAGWLAHASWDVGHHRINRVVPRWYAEACLVVDVALATVLLTVGV
jgi:hypothetical protein